MLIIRKNCLRVESGYQLLLPPSGVCMYMLYIRILTRISNCTRFLREIKYIFYYFYFETSFMLYKMRLKIVVLHDIIFIRIFDFND